MDKKHGMIKLDRKNFIKKMEKFTEFYEINPKPIGRGTYGEVYLCRHRITKDIRAVKIIRKISMANVENFLIEIECLKTLVIV